MGWPSPLQPVGSRLAGIVAGSDSALCRRCVNRCRIATSVLRPFIPQFQTWPCGLANNVSGQKPTSVHGRSQGGSGRHAVRSSSIKERTFGERWRLDGYTARTAGPSVEYSLRTGSRRAERRSSLIKKVASFAMPYPARVASRKASAFVELKRPLTTTVRMCPSMLKRQSPGRPP